MPCLDEAETVATCVAKALAFLHTSGIDGEVVVADNGSTDGSPQLAAAAGARVVTCAAPGYGNALMAGIRAACGRYVIMGDADDSYDFTALTPFVKALDGGADLVMGDRFRGGIAPGAMPFLHRYIGNPLLSALGRTFFGSPVHDFHCGLRGFRRDAILALGLQATGMEFASEMVVKATLNGLRITEVPTTLSPAGRSRPPHLRSWSDGWRHLRFLLLYSPRWLFLIPGLVLMSVGLVAGAALVLGPVSIGRVTFDVDTLVAAGAALVIGYQAVLFALLTKIYAAEEGFLPPDRRVTQFLQFFTLERGLAVGAIVGLAGLAGLVASLVHWNLHDFGALDPRSSLRLVVPSAAALVISFQTVFAALFASVLGIPRVRPRTEPAPTVAAPTVTVPTPPGHAAGDQPVPMPNGTAAVAEHPAENGRRLTGAEERAR
jgi:hypothetical protein